MSRFAGSCEYGAQPHDQSVASLSSDATCFAARVSSFTISSHAAFGFRPSRPPLPRFVWKPSISPSRDGGMPIASSGATSRRNIWRSVRLPRIGPCLESCGAEK